MYFDLTDDQKAIRDSVESLLADHLSDDRLVPGFDAGALDRALWEKLAALGLGGVLVPEAQGGLGLDLLMLAVVAEALGSAGAAVPATTNALAAWLIATAGDEGQCERWLIPLMEGRAIAAFALAEAGSGWQPGDWTLSGAKLEGAKAFVDWGAEADLLIVGLDGGRLALVEAAGEEVSRTSIDPVDRNHPFATIAFSGAVAEPLSTDDETVAKLRDALLVLLAADACGAGRRALAMAVDYAKVRTQFDRLIGSFQGLKHQLANMTAEMEPCRQLYWFAAHAWDRIPAKRSYAAAMAKAHVGDVAVATARRAVEAHGGIGYTWEYPLHIFLKRAMHDRAALGLPALHRARAAELLGW